MKRAEQHYRGVTASPGLAAGPLARGGGRRPAPPLPAGTADEEAEQLHRALADAGQALAALAGREGGEAASILELQIDMLADPQLIEPALADIARGAPAREAWSRCMQGHIDTYLGATDEAFRARATDLEDMRERVGRLLAGEDDAPEWLPDGAIVLDHDLTPSRFLSLDWQRLGGAALIAGSPASHVAVLARARGVPLVTGLGCEPAQAAAAILDADSGDLVLNPGADTCARYEALLHERRRAADRLRAEMGSPAVTADGVAISVMVNVDDPATVSDSVLRAADGVGLVRTEAMYRDGEAAPDEAAQLRLYRGLLARLGEAPCTFRTLDIGGDKPLAGLALAGESNPFMGLRGIRLCLERPDVFIPQIRALLQVAVDPRVRVMLPMVTVAEEIAEARRLFATCLDDLQRQGIAARMPPLGIMVETPAAALTVASLAADFYSIGSNDLTQYTMAAARDGTGRVAALNRPGHPAVLQLIEGVVRFGQASGREVSLCGDIGADVGVMTALLRLGLRRLSVAPSALAHVKQCIRVLSING